MAITTNVAIEKILKTYYKDKVANLLFRNSPVVKEIKKERVEGKEQAFASIYSRGGAVSADATVAEAKAKTNVRNAEWKVTPGQLFSMFSYNAKEVQASLSKKGAYMKVAANKAFAAAEAFRKTLAAAFYGRGYGEIGIVPAAAAGTHSTQFSLDLSDSAIMKIDVGSTIAFKSTVAGAEIGTANVDAIDENTITVTPAASVTLAGGEIVAIAGCVDSSGNPMLPMGLDGWLPVVETRNKTGSTWPTYITTPFFNVTRSVNPSALAGQFILGVSGDKKVDTIQKLIKKVRRKGSQANLIILNDNDWLEVSNEIQSTNTYFTQTSSKARREANVGFDKLSASFSTNFIDNIVDDPYMPEGKFYVLDKDQIELWAYTNSEIVNDGVAGNEPGKADPLEENGATNTEDKPFKLLIDDFLTVVPGGLSSDGDSVRATIQLFGSFVVLDTSVMGVGIFYDATKAAETVPYSSVLGVL